MIDFYFKTMVPVFGLFFGSFANVLIYRIPRNEEWVRTPSHCPNCAKRLDWYDMIPLLSWIVLRGKCRSCKAPISVQYPLVELVNGALWFICATVFGASAFLPVALAVSTSLLVLAAIDIKTKEIPDGINFFLLIAGIFWNGYALFMGYGILRQNLIGFFCVSVPLLLTAIATDGGMGGGDIKLTAVCGLILGWENILLSLALASIFGTAIMLPISVVKKRGRKNFIPFGPFLAAGIFIAMCYGKNLIDMYLRYI